MRIENVKILFHIFEKILNDEDSGFSLVGYAAFYRK